MINAKAELIQHIGNRTVKYVRVYQKSGYDEDDENAPTISGSLEEVLPRLDFEYDNGYGSQALFGYIWYADGSWSERGEYDGSEWWEHKTCPPIPK